MPENLNNKFTKLLTWLLASLIFFDLAFSASRGWARLGWLIAGYALLALVYFLADFRLADIGLARKNLGRGVKFAAPVVALVLIIYFIVYLVHKSTFHDPRYHQHLSSAVFAALVLLLLKTVFFEELAFRGIMPALFLKTKASQRFAAAASALAFGAWHVVRVQGSNGDVLAGNVRAPSLLVICLTFLATSAAGYIFYELRLRSGSLVAPIMVHWSINGIALILAALSWG